MQKIFIIHGWTYTLDAWKDCEREMRARGLDPVFLKVPGLTAPSDEVWNLEKYVGWLENELAQETDVILAGHSNGGRIAIAYAAKNPSTLRKLILIDAAGIVHNEFPLRLKRAVFGALAAVGRPLSRIPLVDKVFHRIIGARDYGRASKNMRETMKNLISVDLTLTLGKISVPTLIIWGEKDAATPIADARVMRAHIPDSSLFSIPDTGHSPHKTHPAVVAEKISEFVR